jgi:hypothetical protein
MSYLEMKSAPLPDMSSGIISLWFRDATRKKSPPQPQEGRNSNTGTINPPIDPPPAEVWPQGFWTDATAAVTMVPPNAEYSVNTAGYDPNFKDCVFFFNPYGLPLGGPLGGLIFGEAFLGAAPVWIPNSPPFPLNTMSIDPKGAGTFGVADVDMSKYGIRSLMTFGDTSIDYEYCTWRSEKPPVIPGVHYLPNLGIGPIAEWPDWPPPYAPYSGGLVTVANYRLNPPVAKFKVPPSFIGIDDDGYLVINLQTSSRASYKGMSFEMINVKELKATATYLDASGGITAAWHWVAVPGYWNGYEFEYKDISQQIMGCAPESFYICGRPTGVLDFAFDAPVIHDGGWHHLLFSFDISGAVTVDQTDYSHPIVNSACKAWLAFDDKNITGTSLQNRSPNHDGLTLPKLRGTETTQIIDWGPCMTYGRGGMNLGANGIAPRNSWIHGYAGNPRDNLLRGAYNASIITDDNDKKNTTARMWGGVVGDFNWMDWTGSIWPLYGHGQKPGPWQATFDPMHPTVPDPKTFDAPSYSCSGFSIPVNGNPIGIPAGSDLYKYNTGVEMAEFQMWANKTLDTSDINMRRLFIDANGEPVSPGAAERVLGRPDILLHGASGWKSGSNTGKSGMTAEGDVIPAGQFEPVAKILQFKPDPQLGK